MSGIVEHRPYSIRYVAFIDILGFSEFVRRSIALPKQTEKLISTLESIANVSEEYGDNEFVKTDDFKAQSFSDCIVMSENASPTGLFHLLFAASALSLDLLQNGIFTRGGIAKGLLHHSDKAVFGPAMLDAYRLEATIARYPRILIDQATHQDYRQPHFLAQKTSTGRSSRLAFDDDGPPFLDFLHLVRQASPDMGDEIEQMRTEIQAALNASVYEPKHFEKLRWLTIYWNSVAAERGASHVTFPKIVDGG